MPSRPESRRGSNALRFIGAVNDQWQMFSDIPEDYSIGPPIGFGASSIVHLSRYRPADGSPSVPCAIKVVDLDKLPQCSLRLLRRETQLMSLSKHPNLLRVRGSWVAGHNLYIALRLMNAGSAADVMRYGWPGGMDEEVVKCILKQALEGLNYLHINGFIHRDVKAANLLIDDDGTVLLGDLGVAASLSDDDAMPSRGVRSIMNLDGNDKHTGTPHSKKGRLGKRKSFVGTPCWMAPEIISGKQYDAKADIWSFGITAIELTQGRAPRSRESPARVLLRTVQDEPPNFSRENGRHKFTRAFKEIVEACVAKDPSLRPSAAELLESPFFKFAKKKNYLVGTILKNLPPLTSRQERHLNPHAPNFATRSSMSSWDFSVDLHPSVSTTHEGARPWINALDEATANATIRYRRLNSSSPNRSHLSKPSVLEREELNSRPNKHDELQNADCGKGPEALSPESSVFELSDDESSSAVQDPGLRQDSSAATTPLSCSPSVAPVVNTDGVMNANASRKNEYDAKPTVKTPRWLGTTKVDDTKKSGRRSRRLSMPVQNWMKFDTTEPRKVPQQRPSTSAGSRRDLMPASSHRRPSVSESTKSPLQISETSPSASSGKNADSTTNATGSYSARDAGYALSASPPVTSSNQDAAAAHKGVSRWRMLVRNLSPGRGDSPGESEQRRNPISRLSLSVLRMNLGKPVDNVDTNRSAASNLPSSHADSA